MRHRRACPGSRSRSLRWPTSPHLMRCGTQHTWENCLWAAHQAALSPSQAQQLCLHGKEVCVSLLRPLCRKQPATCPQVLLLDADNQPLRNPAPLFEAAPFRTHGGLFWPDWCAPGRHQQTCEPDVQFRWSGELVPRLAPAGCIMPACAASAPCLAMLRRPYGSGCPNPTLNIYLNPVCDAGGRPCPG